MSSSASKQHNDKEESGFWDKIGTLGRKKRIKEVQEVQEEGAYAIDSPGNPNFPDIDYNLSDNEQRSIIQPQSLNKPEVRDLFQTLIEWINDELVEDRIIVTDIEQDLYDGQVLHKLWEKLTGNKLNVLEVTQSEEGQRQKLTVVLNAVNHKLGYHHTTPDWTVDSIHSKNIVSILHLLVALVRFFRAPIRLPENVSVTVVVVKKAEGKLHSDRYEVQLTSHYDDLGMRCERDAFDTLFDHAPEKLQVVKKSLVTFVNKHLNKLNFEVNDLGSDFKDGVYLCLLMGLLGQFFVPLHEFHLTPKDTDQMIHNVAFSFDLMQDVGLAKPKARPEDIVNMDLKSTLRCLYNLFTKYRNIA